MRDFARWKIFTVFATVLVFIFLALPNFLPASLKNNPPAWLPGKTVNLGLDLRGGSHLLLQINSNAFFKDQLTTMTDELRLALRKAKLEATAPKVQQNTLVFESPAGEDALQAVVDAQQDGMKVNKDGNRVTVSYSDKALKQTKERLASQSIEIVDRRVNETGTREPIIQRQGEDRILVQVPGLENPDRLKQILGKTAKMTFHLVDTDVSQEDIASNNLPLGTVLLPSDDPTEVTSSGKPFMYAVKSRAVLTGDMLTDASATYQQGKPVVTFKFNHQGAEKFGRITTDNAGKPFAVVLDDKVITAPRINEPILGGSGIITGRYTIETASDLAVLLRAGALPAPLDIIEERSVGPSLGADSIQSGKLAAMLGMALIIVFMLICYGLFGLFANVALLINVVMILGALSLFQATLTLPGIAGIVLTFGMAVDANVLIFERIREEISLGKSPQASVDLGFRNAFNTIMDSNVTALIGSMLLYIFGSGTIKGFAVTLSIGIVCSMFTAILLTRLQISYWLFKRRPRSIPI